MNLRPTLEKLYKQGSFGGWCFTFLHKLVDFPGVGDSLTSKKQALQKFGIPIAKLDEIKVGDIILTNESLYFGHGALVNEIVWGIPRLTESNFSLNLKVNHNRLLPISSKAILGVFRGAWKFEIPEAPYNIPLRIKLVMNNQPDWKTLTKHAFNAINWIYKASQGRLLPVIDWQYINVPFTDNDFLYQPDSLGQLPVKIIKEDWLKAHIDPLTQGFDFAVTVIPKKDFLNSVFNDKNLIELGYAYPNSKHILIALDENDDYPPFYPNLGAFAKVLCHELAHKLYQKAGGEKVVPGGDYTHNWFYGLNGYPVKPDGVFGDLDYKKLT